MYKFSQKMSIYFTDYNVNNFYLNNFILKNYPLILRLENVIQDFI